jgi:hypothetical protein
LEFFKALILPKHLTFLPFFSGFSQIFQLTQFVLGASGDSFAFEYFDHCLLYIYVTAPLPRRASKQKKKRNPSILGSRELPDRSKQIIAILYLWKQG